MSFVRNWLPPALRHFGNRMLGAATTYKGPFESWADATRSTAGYADDAILARVIAATQRVLDGSADYEQDGTAKHGLAPPSHALASLLSAAAAEGGALRVVDFGGGLASHYLRWLPLLGDVPNLHWCVVEQPHFVEAGRRLFAGVPQVSFTSELDEARAIDPNAALASSVLQYLESPLDMLHSLASLEARVLVIDRTPFSVDGRMHILAQRVPATLGRASYPLWMLSPEAVRDVLHHKYEQRLVFTAADHPIDVAGLHADFAGGTWWRRPEPT
jgi:putative methyltransferase (TIGR04325 family)